MFFCWFGVVCCVCFVCVILLCLVVVLVVSLGVMVGLVCLCWFNLGLGFGCVLVVCLRFDWLDLMCVDCWWV